MGYFGKTITASDKSADMSSEIEEFFGFSMSDDDDAHDWVPIIEPNSLLTKEIIEERLEEFLVWIKHRKIDIEDAQTVAHLLLIKGVELTDEHIDSFIRSFNLDDTFGDDLERKVYMKLAIKDLINYKVDKTPIDIEHYFDFEHYYIHKRTNKEMLSELEIVKLIYDLTDIEVNDVLSDNYSLFFVVSKENFEKLNGSTSIFGVKIIKKFN